MKCKQYNNQSILEHGISVRNYFIDLFEYLNGKKLKYHWKIPEWLESNKQFVLNNLLDIKIIELYTIFHDCGKPYCIVEQNNNIHFTNHANISYEIWTSLFPDQNQVASLIKMDMDIHTIKAEQLKEFVKRKECITLLLVGLSEIHSNAEMFGGIDSNSFKIKYKHIDRRGKAIINVLVA